MKKNKVKKVTIRAGLSGKATPVSGITANSEKVTLKRIESENDISTAELYSQIDNEINSLETEITEARSKLDSFVLSFLKNVLEKTGNKNQ